MTDQELRDLVASLAISQKETAQQQKETAEQLKETDLILKETAQQQKETAQQQKETDRRQKETDRQLKETDRQVRELGRQIGGLGDKFGSFTEGLALPSMTRILTEEFQMDFIAPRARSRKNGRTLEVDVLAWANSGINRAFVVEVKSHLREEALDQMRSILREVRHFFPELEGKEVHGILATVDAPDDLSRRVLAEGIYLARIHDGQFELRVPADFKPRAF